MNIEIIMDSIIPDNIKDIPLVKKCTDIFIEMLNRNASVAQRIINLYSIDRVTFLQTDKYGNVTEISDSDFLADTKNNLKNALFNTYLNVIYNLAQEIQLNPRIKEANVLRDYKESLINKNIYDILTSEYLGAFRYYQQNAGTKKAIKYIYQFAKYLETGYIHNDLEIDENGCFTMLYSGSLHKHYFYEFNQPLSHPCGWCYDYTTIVEMLLNDYYGIEYILTPDRIVLKRLNDTIVFTNLSINDFYDSLSQPYNFASDTALSEDEITEIQSKPISVATNMNTALAFLNNNPNSIVLFNVNFNTIKDNVIYFDDTILDYNNGLYYGQKKYYGNCNKLKYIEGFNIVLGNIKSKWNFTYYDEMIFEESMNLYGTSNYLKNNYSNAFKLYSGTYPFTPGIDESKRKVNNYSLNNYNSFNLNLEFNTNALTYFKVSDNYGHANISNREDYHNTLSFNTHGWHGDILNIEAKNYDLDFYFRINILNKIDKSIVLNTFKLTNDKLIIKGTSTSAGVYTVNVGTSGSSNYQTLTDTFNSNIDLELSVHKNILSVTLTNATDTLTIDTNMLLYSDFELNIPYYTPNISNISTTAISTNNMIGYPTSGKTLTQLSRTGYTFINEGFSNVSVDSDDSYVVDSTKFATDEFDCDLVLTGLFLSCTNSKNEGSYSTNKFLTVYDDEEENGYTKERGMIGNILCFK